MEWLKYRSPAYDIPFMHLIHERDWILNLYAIPVVDMLSSLRNKGDSEFQIG